MTSPLRPPILAHPRAVAAASSPPVAVAPAATTAEEARRDAAWDALVERMPGGDLVQTTIWASIRQGLGTRVCHLRVHAPDGTLLGGCLIQHRRVLPGIRIGAVPRGPLLVADRPGAAATVVAEMIAAARRLGLALLAVQPPEGAAAVDAALAAAGFRPGAPAIAPAATVRLDLRRSEADLLAGLNATRRRRVRQYQREQVETALCDDLDAFHRLHLASAARQGFPPLPLRNLQAQWDVLAPLGMSRILIARRDGVPVAGEWITVFGGEWTSKLRGYDATHPASGNAPTGAMWESILEARRDGAHRFDFGGFDRASAEALLAGRDLPPGFAETPSHFKRSFGGEVTLLPGPRFILPNRLAHAALAGLAQRFFAHDAARRLTQAIRAAQ
jgi:lipid II:glycine glycyltransferase (peptidoglycan interpeptide bridge formation enzyme)